MKDFLKDQLSKIGGQLICPMAVVIRNNSILLGLRNYTPEKWKAISVYTMPGGRCETNESVETTLRREIKEEVNITDFELVDFIGEVPGAKEGDIVPIFFCTTNQEPQLMEPEKFSEWKWVPIKEYLSGEPKNAINPVSHKLIREFLLNKNVK